MKKGVIAVLSVLCAVFMLSVGIARAESLSNIERNIRTLREKMASLQEKQQQLITNQATQPELDTLSVQIEQVKSEIRAAENEASGGKQKARQVQIKKATQQQVASLEREVKIEDKKNAIGKAEVELDQVNGQIAVLKSKGASKNDLKAIEAKAKKLKENLSALKKELAGL